MHHMHLQARFVFAIQVPRLRAKTAALIFREQFDSLVKDISSAMDVIRSAVQQVPSASPSQLPCSCTIPVMMDKARREQHL